jgi:hypothetical protein
MFGARGEILHDVPLLIFGEATEQDWEKSLRARGGEPLGGARYPFHYFVSSD